MTRIIHILGNSGAGKSVLAVNLGVALSEYHDTLLVDANIYSPSIHYYLDLSPKYYLNDFLSGAVPLDAVVANHPSGLRIIPSIVDMSGGHERINEALLSLIGRSEIVLVDNFSFGPSLFPSFHASDEALFVTHDDFPSILKSKDFIDQIERTGINISGIILNKRGKSQLSHVEHLLGKKVLAEIPHDESLIQSVNRRKPVYLTDKKSGMSKAITELRGYFL
jgi:MinD-like ATPase involved in chromosome partitioning or flagellar assembly